MRFILVIGMLFAGLVISGTFGQTVFADGPEEPPHTATTPAPDPIQPVAIHELLHRVNEANDPQSVWGALSPQEQTALLNLEVDRIETSHTYGIIPFNGNHIAKGASVSGGATAKSTSCWYKQQKKTGYHWPFKVWSYYQRVEWCGNGSALTSTPHRSRWGDTHMLFWSFIGHIGGSTSGGNGDWSFSASTQGKFSVCYPESTCLYSYTPWLNITAYANGTYSQ